MFWALILEPFKRYTQEVKRTFHITMASLDTSLAANNEAIQIMVHNNHKNFLLCTLMKGKINQVPLDLKFKKGSEITLFSNGQGYVHLTGYVETEPERSDDEANDPEKQKKVNEQAQKKLEENKKDKSNGTRQKMEKPKLNKAKQGSLNESSNQDDDEFSEEDSDNIEDDNSDEYEYYDYDDDEADDDNEKEEEEEEEEEDDDDDDDDDDEKEEEEEEEEEEKQEEKQDQKREQSKLGRSQKQEKISENQQKKKHDKQIKINGEEIKQQQNLKRKRKLENQTQHNSSEAKKRILEGGVQVEDLQLGIGKPIESGDIVSIYYIGRCKIGKEDKKIDACMKGKGHKFRLGRGQVLKGWDVGVVGMKLGGKRRLTIPPDMAYGSKGFPPTIPPFSTLTFEIELKDIHK